MHSIKKAARREAWYHNADPNEPRTYNLWGRVATHHARKKDEESGPGLQHVQTENDAGPSPIEERRRKSFQNGPEASGVRRAGSGEMADVSSDPEKTAYNQRSTGLEDRPNHPTKRKFFMPWKKREQTDKEVEEDEKKVNKRKNWPKPTVMGQVKAVFGSWINIMLIFVPIGIALNYAGVNKIVVFVINFLAIIPLAAVLSYATEEIALYTGEVMGGLLNATFGNAVELIVSIIALTQGKILIVQTSLIGSMLSNLLLVLGMCFAFGGIGRKEQFFNVTVAQTASSLLALAIGSLIIPTAFRIFSSNDKGVAPVSRGTSVLLLVTYISYLIFQLSTHSDMYNEPSQKSPRTKSGKKDKGDASKGIATIGAGTAAAAGGNINNQENLVREEEEEGEVPQLSILGALLTLGGSTVLVALCAEYMVSAIDTVAKNGVSEEFIGLILLPIVGNAAEHATAVTVAIKDKLDLSIGVAVGSSLQIALLVLPLMVLFNWWGLGAGYPEIMTLNFDGFQIAVLFISIIVVNYLIQDGKSHWLEGVLLEVTYLIIALAAWYYPNGTGE